MSCSSDSEYEACGEVASHTLTPRQVATDAVLLFSQVAFEHAEKVLKSDYEPFESALEELENLRECRFAPSRTSKESALRLCRTLLSSSSECCSTWDSNFKKLLNSAFSRRVELSREERGAKVRCAICKREEHCANYALEFYGPSLPAYETCTSPHNSMVEKMNSLCTDYCDVATRYVAGSASDVPRRVCGGYTCMRLIMAMRAGIYTIPHLMYETSQQAIKFSLDDVDEAFQCPLPIVISRKIVETSRLIEKIALKRVRHDASNLPDCQNVVSHDNLPSHRELCRRGMEWVSGKDVARNKNYSEQEDSKRRRQEPQLKKRTRLRRVVPSDSEDEEGDWIVDDDDPLEYETRRSSCTNNDDDDEEEDNQEIPDNSEGEDEEECCVCNKCGTLVMCDGCNKGYHLECAGLQSDVQLEEEWFCTVCTAPKADRSASKASRPSTVEVVQLDADRNARPEQIVSSLRNPLRNDGQLSSRAFVAMTLLRSINSHIDSKDFKKAIKETEILLTLQELHGLYMNRARY